MFPAPPPIVEDGPAAVARVFGALHPPVTFDGLTAEAEYHPQPEHRGNPGWLHGGMAATLLDHICARAASHALSDRVVTGTLDLRYRRSIPLDGGPYRLTATAHRLRPRTVRVQGAILDSDGKALVEARSLFVILASSAPRAGRDRENRATGGRHETS